jgi:uncharacterized protein YuzE
MAIQGRYNRQVLNPYETVNGPVFVAEDDNGKIVGVAIGRRTVEAFMAVDPEISNYKKARAVKGLAAAGADALKKFGYCEYHAFTTDPAFLDLLDGLPGAHKDERLHAWINLVEDKNGK